MEQITVAGHPEPVAVSEIAARQLRERLDAVREQRGADAADHLEQLVGQRIGILLAAGTPSIDVATMRSIVNYVELPAEEETPAGLGRTLENLREKLSQRGGLQNMG
ncbi:hypothetical protein [Brachybacterium aquaticum]|uniref:Uncharacterized protein n=1 Tax=Brachybacterium aquaticum TaxID=1432564 RepID=A0A841AHI6_9MICO|nr:hypothetical protein [Brachybacterium aquaticum]MBB5832534.1 hypothetical protein [Brachybacterium aquaticum]